MSAERWHKVTAIFHAALEQPSSEVDEFLRRQCGADAELYSEVRSMVERHAQSGVLDRPAAALLEAQPVFAAGEMVSGRYRIGRFLGRGGMGEVYEAEDLDLKERVALKTLLPEIAGDGRMIARFKQEIQLSRKIAHPNVCRVFDLARHPADGSAPQPVVYLTMELLAGETLAERLHRERRLSTAAALPLLGQMAEALDAAHRAGVIHRDFKPSNVMLVPGAAGVRAVVTDFGLARSLEGSGETTATLTGKLMGTLDYMAPELLTGAAATIASDVYALGMTAYKMVTGDLPFAAETPLAGAILRSKVPVPSPRDTVPDLDSGFDRAIVRALDPEPARRYSSARQFADALRGDAPSVTVTLPAMTRRRAVAAAAAAAVLIAGGFGWRAWNRSRHQPPPEALSFYSKGVDDIHAGAYFAATKALEQAVRRAPHFTLAHARLAEAWNELDVSDKASQEMLAARRESASAMSREDRLQLEAVDLTITREFDAALAKYLQIPPAGQTGLFVDLGRAYERDGQPQQAIESFRRAAEGPSHDPAAWLWLGVLYGRASNWPMSDEAFRRAEEEYQLTSNLEGLTEVEYQRGIFANTRGALDEAADHLRKAAETARISENIHQELSAELRLGTNAYLAGDADGAERHAQHALELAQTNQMEPLAIRGLITLGGAYFRKQDYTGAEKYYQQALGLARRYNSQHLTALALLSLAADHDQLNRSADTVREAQDALGFYQTNHYARESLQCFTLLGRAEAGRGNYSAALDWYQRSLSAAEKAGDRAQIALAHESVGSIYFTEEQFPKALDQYSLSLQQSADDEHVGYAALQCADVLWRLARYDEARQALDQAGVKAVNFPRLQSRIQRAQAEMELSQGHYAKAASEAQHALEGQWGKDPVNTADLRRILGSALFLAGRKREGQENCEQALKTAVDLGEPSLLLRARIALAFVYAGSGHHSSAAVLIRAAESALQETPETRFRAFALLASWDANYRAPALRALSQLASDWGDEAFRRYRTRPGIQDLWLPLEGADHNSR